MMNLSMVQTLSIWSDLEAAYHGRGVRGTAGECDTARIDMRDIMPRIGTDREKVISATASLVQILKKFEEDHYRINVYINGIALNDAILNGSLYDGDIIVRIHREEKARKMLEVEAAHESEQETNARLRETNIGLAKARDKLRLDNGSLRAELKDRTDELAAMRNENESLVKEVDRLRLQSVAFEKEIREIIGTEPGTTIAGMLRATMDALTNGAWTSMRIDELTRAVIRKLTHDADGALDRYRAEERRADRLAAEVGLLRAQVHERDTELESIRAKIADLLNEVRGKAGAAT